MAGSVKVTRDAVSAGRVLCSLPRAAFAPQSTRRFLAAAEAFAGVSCDALLPVLDLCDMFHFGIDPKDQATASGGNREVRKVYAELATSPVTQPGLNYLALKVAGGRGLLTRYVNHPVPDRAAAVALLDGLTLPASLRPAAEAFLQELADQPAPPDVLDVVEQGSPRRSVDINFSDQPLTGRGKALLQDLLCALRPTDAGLSDLLRPALSHVAIGSSATGQPFVTLYGFPPATDRKDGPDA